MFSEEQKRAALELYDELGSAGRTVERLGYPSRACLRNWAASRGEPPAPRKPAVRLAAEEKEAAVARVLGGEPYREVARSCGVAPCTVLAWRRKYLEGGGDALVTDIDARRPHAGPAPDDLAALPDDPAELKRRVFELQFENDLMREVLRAVKKGPRVDPGSLSNREKAAVIDAMRGTYSPSFLASRLGIAPSSYHYARKAAAAPDRWAEARAAVVEEFEAAGRARGYRYVRRRLAERGIACGERTVRRLMAEEGCEVVYLRRPKRWSSYAGEVSEAPPNLVGRRFRADAPNRLWVTDITEFRIPGDRRKVYLSAVVDCFDGMLASWAVGTSPSAGLANSSLEGACARLAEGEAPVVHSDRGGHYRWPGWIAICEGRGLTRSMSAKGCSPDNAACEGFFGRLKNEFFHGRDWRGVSADEFMARLEAWLRYYNEGRIKESLGWLSPKAYRESLGLAA